MMTRLRLAILFSGLAIGGCSSSPRLDTTDAKTYEASRKAITANMSDTEKREFAQDLAAAIGKDAMGAAMKSALSTGESKAPSSPTDVYKPLNGMTAEQIHAKAVENRQNPAGKHKASPRKCRTRRGTRRSSGRSPQKSGRLGCGSLRPVEASGTVATAVRPSDGTEAARSTPGAAGSRICVIAAFASSDFRKSFSQWIMRSVTQIPTFPRPLILRHFASSFSAVACSDRCGFALVHQLLITWQCDHTWSCAADRHRGRKEMPSLRGYTSTHPSPTRVRGPA